MSEGPGQFLQWSNNYHTHTPESACCYCSYFPPKHPPVIFYTPHLMASPITIFLPNDTTTMGQRLRSLAPRVYFYTRYAANFPHRALLHTETTSDGCCSVACLAVRIHQYINISTHLDKPSHSSNIHSGGLTFILALHILLGAIPPLSWSNFSSPHLLSYTFPPGHLQIIIRRSDKSSTKHTHFFLHSNIPSPVPLRTQRTDSFIVPVVVKGRC